MMSAQRRQRRDRDCRNGCSHRQMDHVFRTVALLKKSVTQHRYDDDAAADAQHPSQEAGDGAYGEVDCRAKQHEKE